MQGDAQIRRAEIGNVPSHWQVAPLSAFVSRVTYGFTNPMPATDDGPFMVTAKDIHDGRIDYSTARHTDWEAYRNDLTDKSRPRINDILLTKDGSIGRVAICDRVDVCINQSVALIQPNGRINPRFLLYLLQTPHYQRRMEEDSDGTTIKHIYITRVDKMEVAIPPLLEQDAIVGIAGALDEKIELDRRLNETLEAMARGLFKSWFVDFDPVRAKTEGRDPGLPKPIAELFPASFEQSELGDIPAGWVIKTIEDICDVVTRGVTPEYGEGSGRYIVNQRVNRGTRLDWTALKELSPSLTVPANCYAKRWDILVNCLGEGTLGRVHFFKEKSDLYAIDQHMSICRAAPNRAAYLYQVLASTPGQEKIESLKTGSTGMTMLNISKLRKFDLLWPEDGLLDAYFDFVEPMWRRIAANDEEARTLGTLRDILLPKLISGELRIGGAGGLIDGET
jgi:type I restriction enzyme S subunit